ncbi:MAG: hypothetical protein V4773_14590 [Verrucomicrobiota bacterium]
MDTKDGLRCSADTAQVRPFWLRAFGFYGGAMLAVYLTGAIVVFAFLRYVGYPVSIVHVALPPLWHRVVETRSWFFLNRSSQAFTKGNTSEGLLYLASAYEFDPGNYAAGMSLAKHFQVTQPSRSDQVFEKLMRDHPDKRSATAQDWFRALLSRGSFERISTLARDEILEAPAHGGVWLRALFFATRQTGGDAPLRAILAARTPQAQLWHPLIDIELLVRAGRKAEAIAALNRPMPANATPFDLYYRIDTLIDLREIFPALDLLGKYTTFLARDPQAANTLLLKAYALGSSRSLVPQVETLLEQPFNASLATLVSAHVIRYPNQQVFLKLWEKFQREPLPLTVDNVGAWFSVLCAAGAVGDQARLQEISARLKQASATPFMGLTVVEAFFRGDSARKDAVSFLPILPLPMDVTYALFERYPTPGPGGRLRTPAR